MDLFSFENGRSTVSVSIAGYKCGNWSADDIVARQTARVCKLNWLCTGVKVLRTVTVARVLKVLNSKVLSSSTINIP